MPKSRSAQQCDYSLSMALAAIEIYNKPGFHNREHVFCILIVNAWESLTKAKLLKDHGNKLSAIRKRENGSNRFQRTRHGDIKTIDVWESVSETIDSKVVTKNINSLVRLRNEFVHHMPQTRGLTQLVHALATATLDNYAYYIHLWFGVKVSKFNFFILPLGFDYPFTKLSAINLRNEPEVIQEIIRGVIHAQQEGTHQDKERALVLEIGVDIASAKKAMRDPDFYTNITDQQEGSAGYIDQRDFNDRYPYKFTEMHQRVMKSSPECSRNLVLKIVKEHNIKRNPKLSGYLFTDRKERERGVQSNTPSRYNDDCVKFIISTFRHENDL